MKYITQPWDTIQTIASKFGVDIEAIKEANPSLYSRQIYPGIILTIPGYETIDLPPEGYVEYVVQPGDTLYNIAYRFNLDYRRVRSHNPQIVNPNVIWPGQIIYLIYLGY
ncbi:LysM peptidoglycan-binding domain-containing protein [Sporosalibacterium faouarense]|uniref:LysM peptidoglycan-binding domain-containing protein n=1 Tax=Sporosalibacterium faouarense TaxID=516123 RepID=UPI00141C5885|nr:LysM peptidoglycan-binding domain-containing protein [Sporosalibacterium faouarense]MTI49580.1 LysM peptidoglycan-binding domain-containing protein [Bacillota bacterium]